jgi:hypothetical protein
MQKSDATAEFAVPAKKMDRTATGTATMVAGSTLKKRNKVTISLILSFSLTHVGKFKNTEKSKKK